MNQGCGPGFASAAPATATCSCFHQERFKKCKTPKNPKTQIEDFEDFEYNFHKITCTVDFRILAHQAVAITGTAMSVEHVGLQTRHIPKMFVPPVLGFDF